MMRSILARITVLVLLLVLLLPAIIYLTSPWWAPQACRWAAARFWKAEVRFATATVNPFTLSFEGAGGTFQTPPGEGYKAAGDLSRMRIRIEAVPLIFERRIRSISLELASITVTLAEGRKILPFSSTTPPGTPGDVIPAALQEENPRRSWVIDHLNLKIDRGVLRYNRGGRQGEVSMDLNFNTSYENVRDVKLLAADILKDLLSKAAFGFLTQGLFR